ncbi:MAG: acyltransferase family protein [Halobacteriota archaeon]
MMQRLYYFDNLKIVLILVVIFFHAGMAYIPVAEGWPVTMPGPIPFIGELVVGSYQTVSNSFMMALFFFISAYFIAGSFDRKGRRTFLKDRFVRVGLPLVAVSALYLGLGGPAAFSFGYLWFLIFLLILAVTYSVWRRFDITVRPVRCPGNGTLALAALALGTADFVVRGWYGVDQWVLWHGVEPAHVLFYALFAIGGILAYRNGWLEAAPRSLVKTWGCITLVSVCITPVLFVIFDGFAPLSGGFTLVALLSSLWEAFMGIGIATCLLIVSKYHWNTTGRIKAALAKNVYTVYLIQIPVILYLQGRFVYGGVLIPAGLPLLLQFVLVGGLAAVLCFLISNYVIRKVPHVDRVLF